MGLYPLGELLAFRDRGLSVSLEVPSLELFVIHEADVEVLLGEA